MSTGNHSDATSPETSLCTGPHCGRVVRWVVTEADRRLPIDPEPHPAGNIVPVVTEAGVRARVLGGGQLPVEPPAKAYRSHYVTCPDAELFRRKRGASRTPRRLCADPACGLPMDADLAVIERWRVHPSCTDPAVARPAPEPPSSPAQCGEALPGLDGPLDGPLGGAR